MLSFSWFFGVLSGLLPFLLRHLDLELWRIPLPWDLLPLAGKGNWSWFGGKPDVSSRKGWLTPTASVLRSSEPLAVSNAVTLAVFRSDREMFFFSLYRWWAENQWFCNYMCKHITCSLNPQLFQVRFVGWNWEENLARFGILELLKLGNCPSHSFSSHLVVIVQCSGFSLIPLSSTKESSFKAG